MAWRIDEQVIRGEIDNRTRGRVTGRVWFAGRTEPVELDLEGNCWRDLAGRRLEFTNPEPKLGDLASFATLQQGTVGDITASRRVKVPEIPMNQIGEYYAAKKPWPWHWGNSLYLEWFSRRNGRVMIESSSFDLRINGGATWEMTPDEEIEQRKANGAAITGFMDLLVDRINARMQREGEGADYEKIMEEEIERLHREFGEPEPTPEDLARNAEWIEEANRAAGEAVQNPDPELETELALKHPLAERAFEFCGQIHQLVEDENLLPEDATEEHPVAELDFAVMGAAAKLAGALNSQMWPPPVELCAGIVVRLKLARVYLDDALRATESCKEEKMVASQHLGPIVLELIDLANDVDGLIAELRAKLERGTD